MGQRSTEKKSMVKCIYTFLKKKKKVIYRKKKKKIWSLYDQSVNYIIVSMVSQSERGEKTDKKGGLVVLAQTQECNT